MLFQNLLFTLGMAAMASAAIPMSRGAEGLSEFGQLSKSINHIQPGQRYSTQVVKANRGQAYQMFHKDVTKPRPYSTKVIKVNEFGQLRH